MKNEENPLLARLNPQQRQAIAIRDGPVLILAGPGSGKTRVLTHRIAWMLSEMDIRPWQTMAVTFTNKAAREMRNRLDRMLDSNAAREVTMGTFHAICARILRREAVEAQISPDYLIFDSDDQLSIMKQIVKDLGLDDKRYHPRGLLNAVSSAKNELIPPVEYPVNTYYDEIAARAYARYQDMLRNNNGLDFDDLLMETAKLLRDNPLVLEKYSQRYQHILVDEFQDTNMAQYVILKYLAHEHRSLYVVADEDQSIYSWRGADYRNIRRFRKDFPELQEILLEENYRSTQVILDSAQAIIAQNADRTPKRLFTRKHGGAPITLHEAYDEKEEADYVGREIVSLVRSKFTYSDLAIMYRTNAQSRALEEALVRHNIPYRLIGATRFYARKEIKDILAFLRLVQNPDDDVSFVRVVNVPPRGIGARTLAKVTAEADTLGSSRYQALLSLLQGKNLRGRAHNVLLAFATLLGQWREEHEQTNVALLIDHIIADTQYEAYLRDGTDEGESRWENVLSLRGVVAEAPEITLTEFLTDVALVSDVDELSQEVDAVTLLTLHSAKGLEYPIVFITGLEEGMLPHSRSMESPQDIAEERRLLYVGMTRAEEKLYLSHAFRRSWYGSSEPSSRSRFLEDLPEHLIGEQTHRRQKRSSMSTARPKKTWGTERWQKRAPKQVEAQFRSGQRVHHSYYGEGMVLESELDGRNEMVTVIFTNGVGVKKLLAGMAPMEPISEH